MGWPFSPFHPRSSPSLLLPRQIELSYNLLAGFRCARQGLRELLFLVLGFLLFLLWRGRLVRRRRSLVLRLRLRVWRRRLLANRRLSALLFYWRRRLGCRRLNLLAGRRRLGCRRLNLLAGRKRLGNRGLSLLAAPGRRGHRRLNLLTSRREVLWTGGWDGLRLRGLARRLPRSVLGLGRALGEGRCRTGADGRGDRMNLLCVYRLHLHAPGWWVLVNGLGPQGLQLLRDRRHHIPVGL